MQQSVAQEIRQLESALERVDVRIALKTHARDLRIEYQAREMIEEQLRYLRNLH
jgi:hypothetical protein